MMNFTVFFGGGETNFFAGLKTSKLGRNSFHLCCFVDILPCPVIIRVKLWVKFSFMFNLVAISGSTVW